MLQETDQIHLKMSSNPSQDYPICWEHFTATSGWVNSSKIEGNHLPSLKLTAKAPETLELVGSWLSFWGASSGLFSGAKWLLREPTTTHPLSHVPNPSPPPTPPPPFPTACWSNRRSRDSQAKHNDSRSPGHFDKPAGGGWSKAKAPGDSGSKLAPLGYRCPLFGAQKKGAKRGETKWGVSCRTISPKSPFFAVLLLELVSYFESVFLQIKYTVHFIVLHYNTLYYSTVEYNTLHYLIHTTSHYITLYTYT